MSISSIGEGDGESDYVKSSENSPTSLTNTPDLLVHIIELDEIHEVAESEIFELEQPMVLSPALTTSNFQSLTMPRPTLWKTTKAMTPRFRSSPIHLCRTHPCNTPRWPQPRLRHAHESRPVTSHFKRKRDTYQMSAYLALTAYYMTCSSPRRAVSSHSMVCSKNSF